MSADQIQGLIIIGEMVLWLIGGVTCVLAVVWYLVATGRVNK